MVGGTYAGPRARCGAVRARSALFRQTALCGALASGIVAAAGPQVAEAGPQGTTIVGGAVDIRQSGAHTEFTQHTGTALLSHRSFDIAAGESVHFAQPSAGALAVNRVVGGDLPTSIAGRLTADGNVWVLNPSGVAIRRTAQVNVGGLLATAASIDDAAILAGERSFAGAPAGSAVTNAGSIVAGGGGVVLVAPVVSNTGTITTHGSDIALGAGSGFTVDFDGDGLTRFEVSPGSGVGLTNAGTVSAEGGAAYISAASAEAVQTSVVSIGGRVEATRARQQGGVIYISGGASGVTEVDGTLNAAQAAGGGGRIAVAGEKIDIGAGAVIDASGADVGGTIEIGGGMRGAPIASPVLAQAGAPAAAPLPTARRAVVRRGARIVADAGAAGDGGTVVVWAEEAASFRGRIDARGGALEGNGGFAEVSGKGGLAFDGRVDLGGAAGSTGTLLLDPQSVTIVAGETGDAAQDAALDDKTIASTDAPASFTISAGAVAASVAAANTVIEATQAITQQAAVTLTGGNTLTYRTGDGDIALNAALTGIGNALTVDAGGAVTLSDLTVAGLDVTAGGAVAQDAGSAIDVSGGARFTAGGSVTLGAAGNDFSTIHLSGSDVSVADRNAVRLGGVDAATLEVSAGGAVSQAAGTTVRVPGDSGIVASAGGIALTDMANDFADEDSGHAVRLRAPGPIRIADAGSIALGASSGASLEVAASDLSIGGTLGLGGDVVLINAAGDLALVGVAVPDGDPSAFEVTDVEIAQVQAQRLAVTSGAGGIEVRGLTLDAEGLTLDAGAVTFTTAATMVAGDLSVSGMSIVQDANGTLAVDGRTSLSVTGAIALDNGGNDFDADASGADAIDAVDATGTTVALSDRDAIALGNVTATDLHVRAGGSIIDTAGKAIEVAGTTGLTALAGADAFDIRLDNSAAGDRHDLRGGISAVGEDIWIDNGASATLLGAITAHDDASNPLFGVDATVDEGNDGDLTVVSRGPILDTAGKAVVVAGTTDLRAASAGGSLHDIALDEAALHDFSEADPLNAGGDDIAVADRDGIRLGGIVAGGNLSVTARGSVTDNDGEAVIVGGDTTIVALDTGTADPSDDNFFDIALDNAGLHDLGGVRMTGEDIGLLDRQGLTVLKVTSRSDGSPDATLADGGIVLELGQGDFAFRSGQDSTPLDATGDVTLFAPEGSFETDPAIVGKDLPDGLTFRSRLGDITLDLREGFVVEDVSETDPFTLDAPNGISRIRIGEGDEAAFFGIGTADFLDQARAPDFNPFFDTAIVGDKNLFRVTGDFGLIARAPLTVRFQNTLGTANQGTGAIVRGTTFLGGRFAGVSLFGSFRTATGTNSALEGFRDAAVIGEHAVVLENENTVNGCAILVPTSCQPLGSLLPALGYQDGLLLGIRFVAPTQDLDDPFTNRGDEEEWE